MYISVFVKSMLYVTNVLVLITVTNVTQPKKITRLLEMLIWWRVTSIWPVQMRMFVNKLFANATKCLLRGSSEKQKNGTFNIISPSQGSMDGPHANSQNQFTIGVNLINAAESTHTGLTLFWPLLTSRDRIQPYCLELHSDQTMETDSAVMIKHITRFIWNAVKEKLNRKATAQLV